MKTCSDTHRQGGFTLVEIAIVLMIVGLLIGGILRGQELIQSARVRNIIDQKSAIQTAYIGFLDRYRMLPGDLTQTQADALGSARASAPATGSDALAGDGVITWDSEGILFFQNLTAAGFLSCGACMTVTGNGAATVTNSPTNVYGDFLNVGFQKSTTKGDGTSWFDPTTGGLTQLVMTTGGTVPSQVLAEVDRKADDGRPGTGQLRFSVSDKKTDDLDKCAPLGTGTGAVNTWANPSESNCQGSWLF
ncbi:prepilin-type N-terminal cleavage/methylation domain-containing protein [Polaromonas sp. CF318]|uniref:type II secretion system protein n=1 Tax=Polaromonas sp. CF318 TaxID=1144318 RepID=UPI0002713503|nr:prepilin-type N-terminal cleavage/methylation domain-containing protein [Polaromonas sp. CF318]EJL89924.1 prepilin-type N-terminal cleavage/methylation domain-containing protein [Polaromonas sp. CF318]